MRNSIRYGSISLIVILILVLVMYYTGESSSTGNIGRYSDFHTYPTNMLFVSPSEKTPSGLMARDDLEKATTVSGVAEVVPYLHVQVRLNRTNTNLYGFDDIFAMFDGRKKLLFKMQLIGNRSSDQRECVISENFGAASGAKIGTELEGEWMKCTVIGIAESDTAYSANFVITDLVSAQNELISSDPFYTFLNKRSTDAVSCGRCHTVLTKAIKEAVREAALVFDPRMPISGGFIYMKKGADPEKIENELRERLPALSVGETEEFNCRRTMGLLKAICD